MDELIRKINKYPNGTKLIIKWKNGIELRGEIDTIYETDNGLEMDEERYQEYYACAFNVLSIQSSQKEKINIKIGELIEISMQAPPQSVMLEDERLIWENR